MRMRIVFPREACMREERRGKRPGGRASVFISGFMVFGLTVNLEK